MLKGLISPLKESADFNTILKGFSKGLKHQLIYGLSGSISSLFMAGLNVESKSMLVLTNSLQQARKKCDDLKTFLPDKEVLIYPESESVFYDVMAQSKEILSQRLGVLNRLMESNDICVVAPVEAVLKRLTPVEIYRKTFLQHKVGDKVSLNELITSLTQQGYERVNMIEGKGQISLRGGIFDIFPLTSDKPLRIELLDDEIDSIRHFSLENQRSIDKQTEFTIPPARELVISKEMMTAAIENIKKEVALQEKRLIRQGLKEAVNKLNQRFNFYIEQLEQGIYFESIDQLLPFFYPETALLFDYLSKDTVIVLDEPARLKEVIENNIKEKSEEQVSLLEKGLYLPTQSKVYINSQNKFIEKIDDKKIVGISLLPRESGLLKPQNILSINAKSLHEYKGRVEILAEEIKNWRKMNYAVIILVSTDERADKIKDILRDYKIDSFYTSSISREVRPGNVVITKGSLEAGFEYSQEKVVFITDQEIFGNKKKVSRRLKETGEGIKITNIEDLGVGDFIVHINHGIGKYLGIKKLDIAGFQKDYLLIKYAGEDKLYVPTDQVGQIQKFLGAEGKAPKLNKLGGNEWSKAKSKVKESVQEMARELLELYAARQAQKGYAFSSDTVWQKDFEDDFPYEETDDQNKSIKEIKRDMENSRPMDRLLCGDVGYGKTEVAIRSAFKAVMDGKQVAVLVPTTILAQQHYNTFSQRFGGYPVTVEMLSRFRTAKQQKETIEKVGQGRVDIVIGTHRLIQKDIVFKDLGLVVVDEEQRFGVSHKEKLKTIKKNVDVLTLTATPIPRTLHMAVIGNRDISTLENPPEDRFPVQTYVMEFNQETIREAIQKEIDRGGQIYFVHNRIQDISKVAQDLQKILPDARIAIGHGKMREEQLEKTLMEFIEGEYDVLVCTTIIETGLDIPNVNTIIVNEADKYGLSQLYQLRGRVGRSHRVAYAYFTFRREKILSEVAEKRLHAIREFTEFGSGFKIAMRDLELRGAGNILGPEQHGHMMAVGFDLYCSLLENAIKELKGEEIKEKPDTSIEIDIDAYIGDSYISDQAQKIDLYKRIMSIKNINDAADVEEEMEDRYGDIPTPVRNLLAIAKIKAIATCLKIDTIKQNKECLILRFFSGHDLTGEVLVEISKIYQKRITFIATEQFEIKYQLQKVMPEDVVKMAEELVCKIQSLVKIIS